VQSTRSEAESLPLTGSLARLCCDCFGGKTGGVRVSDRRAERGGTLRPYHADNRASAGSPQDHEPVFIHTLLYRYDHMRGYRYIPPTNLLVDNVRREHLDTRDGRTEAIGCKKWSVGGVHTLSFLLYRRPVKGQAAKVVWSSVRLVGPSGCCLRKSDLSVRG
jgi:hypothetical protein